MPDSKSIGIALTKQDKDLVVWLNMLRQEGMHPRTWIQAVLLAEQAGVSLDAGGVYLPSKVPRQPRSASPPMFGDDTAGASPFSPRAQTPGWDKRGENGAFVVGSILTIRISRPVMLRVLSNLAGRHKKLSSYIKAILRKHIRHLARGPNEPPDPDDIRDIFVLYDEYFEKTASDQDSSRAAVKSKKPALENKQKNPLLAYISQ